MSSKLKTIRAAHRRAVIKLLKKGDPTEEPQQDVVNLKSMMELIKTKQKTLSDLNEKMLETIEEEEDFDEEIEEVDRYELEIQIGSRKSRSSSKNLRKAIKKEICIQKAANANPIETEIIPTASFVTETTNKRWRSTGSRDSNDNGHVEISTQLSNITGTETHRIDDKIPSDPQRISQVIDMYRYSDLHKLLTVTGYVLKFVKNCQKNVHIDLGVHKVTGSEEQF
ncbi:unnamed protein product [Mytilus coruscus]|uniref:Uncharacterized protein n=1 Tax=Mytilus coruscus TaxID=42192 RepID=A0A6J8BY00_MYTCO|nr:unnamed protein product [Mytilus coruscus]